MTMKKLNRLNIIWLVVIVILAILVFLPNKAHTPSNYDEMSAGQLLDVKIDYDSQIQALKDKRQIVIDKYNIKRWYVQTGVVEDNGSDPIEQVNDQLGL